MQSHELAQELHKQADYLLGRPEFPIAGSATKFLCYWDKVSFLAAVRALEPCTKEYKGDDLDITITNCPSIKLSIPRNNVCKLVTPAVYDCEPLLSPEEEQSLSAPEQSSSYSPDTEAENNAKPTLVERQAGIDMVLAIDPNPEVL